jgi:hypothetical protein
MATKRKHLTAGELIELLQTVPADTPVGQSLYDRHGQAVWAGDGGQALQQVTFDTTGFKLTKGNKPVVVLWGLDREAYPPISVYEDVE